MNIKGHLLKILLLFVLVGSIVNADIRVIPIYKINGNSVYYRTENGLEKLQNADAKIFEILGYHIAKDKNSVYYWDEKLNKIDKDYEEAVKIEKENLNHRLSEIESSDNQKLENFRQKAEVIKRMFEQKKNVLIEDIADSLL